MGIEALYRRNSPGPSTPAREAAIYPYFIDVACRRVLAWRLSNTLTADVYVAALEEALKKFGPRKFLTSGATPVSGRESDSGNQPPFRTRDGAVTIWLYIIGEREVDGVCRAVFALHEQMDHGAGLAPEE